MDAALFGGSFDPPHIGHEAIIRAACRVDFIEHLFVVPAYLSPFKKSFLCPPEKRLEWMRQLVKPLPKAEVIDYEIRAGRPVPTIETVEWLKERYDLRNLWLIIGADNLSGMAQWHRSDDLLTQVRLLVIPRNGITCDKHTILEVDMPVSSSALREGFDPKFIPDTIAADVTAYFKEKDAGWTG